MSEYKLVDYKPNAWFITFKNGCINIRDYQPIYNIAYMDGKYMIKDNTKHYQIGNKNELEKYAQDCLNYLKEKYPNGKN